MTENESTIELLINISFKKKICIKKSSTNFCAINGVYEFN